MKIAVTGATGFIGKAVVKELLKNKIKPIIIVRKQSRIPNFFLNCEIFKTNLHKIEKKFYFKIKQPDVLIHLAWEGLSDYQSQKHLMKELPNQKFFLENMISSGLKNLFIPGTCFEYGLVENCINENKQLKPVNNYGKAKKKLLIKLISLSKKFKYNLIWARLFYVYGKNQSNRSIFGQLRDAVNKKKTFFNMSDGDQLRDYMSVEEVAKHIVKLSLSKKNLGPINLCSGKPIKVKNLIKKFCKKNKWKIRLNLGYFKVSKNEPKNFWGLPSKHLMSQK